MRLLEQNEIEFVSGGAASQQGLIKDIKLIEKKIIKDIKTIEARIKKRLGLS